MKILPTRRRLCEFTGAFLFPPVALMSCQVVATYWTQSKACSFLSQHPELHFPGTTTPTSLEFGNLGPTHPIPFLPPYNPACVLINWVIFQLFLESVGDTMFWAIMLVTENTSDVLINAGLLLGNQWWENCQGHITISAEKRFPNCTVTLSGTHSCICCCQASESLQERGISTLCSHTINHGYREVTSCPYSLREEVINRSGGKQVGYFQWYMNLYGESRRRTASERCF